MAPRPGRAGSGRVLHDDDVANSVRAIWRYDGDRAPVAQWTERGRPKACVGGSSPSGGARQYKPCTDQSALVLYFRNDTDRVIDVFVLYPDSGHDGELQSDVQRGETSITRGDLYPGSSCSERGVFIARDQSG